MLMTEANMFRYRLYSLNAGGKISHAAQLIVADSDEEAIEQARSKRQGFKCELWEQKRFVATITAESSITSSASNIG
jgi:hypothetical protein